MKHSFLALATLSLVILDSGVSGEAPHRNSGHVVETTTAKYARLRSEASALMRAKRYQEAAAKYKEALNEPLFEEPNFVLLTDLALAQMRAGEVEQARTTIAKAELAVSVLARVMKCVEDSTGWTIVNSLGEFVESPHSKEIAERMCGDAYAAYYDWPSLERFLQDADLVRATLAAKQEILRRK